jgi:hypothetical protein
MGEDAGNGLGKALQAVYTSKADLMTKSSSVCKHTLHASVFEVSKY